MSNILQEIESQIAGLKTAVTKSNVGIVREIGDGAAKIEGLSDVMLNEMIEFPGGVYGLALNLEETEVGCVLLGSGPLRGTDRLARVTHLLQRHPGTAGQERGGQQRRERGIGERQVQPDGRVDGRYSGMVYGPHRRE